MFGFSSRNTLALLAGVSALSLMSTAQAQSQSASDASTDETGVQTVTVFSPQRDSQIAALKEQRNADNLISVIAADTVGRFPDQNSAAALSRLPSVAVQRDQGQERYIQVRGAPNRWTSVSFDGVPVIGVDEGGAGRAFRFDAVPAVILKSLAVNKSLTPELPAEAVVAQIDLRTFSPLARKGTDVQGDFGLGTMELGGNQQQTGALRTSWSNGTFGVLAALSHYRRYQVTDNREFAYDAQGVLSSFDARNYRLMRENNGAALELAWRPSADHDLFAKVIYSAFNDDEERNHYTFQLSSALSGTRTAAGGELVGVPVRSTAQFGEYRTTNTLYTLGGDHQFGQDWDLSWRLNATHMTNDTYLPLLLQNQQINRLNRVSMSYSLRDPNFPIVSLFRTVNGPVSGTFARGEALTRLDQGAFDFNIALPLVSKIRSDSRTAKVDLTRRFDQWTFKTGLMHEDRDITGSVLSTSNTVLLSALLPRVGRADLRASDYVSQNVWDTGFPLGVTINNLDNRRLRTDIEGALGALQSAGLYNPANAVSPADRYDIREKLTSAYGQARKTFDNGQIVFGLRVEHMDQTIAGATRVGTTVTPLVVNNKTTDLFPSVNLKLDLSDKLVVRASAQRGIARASFGAIRTGASINDTSTPGTVTGGNPNLKPEYTWGTDASAEYYLSADSVVSASVFYRLVDNVLYDSKTKVGSGLYNSGGIDRSGYDFVSTLNGGEGKLYGLELNWQQTFKTLPSPFDGLGVSSNLALLDGSFDTAARKDVPFPGTSKEVVNAAISYEKYGISARLSYQWRGDWADTLGGLGLGAGGDEYRKAYGNLDLTLRYALNDNFTLYADAANLTDETYIAYDGIKSRPTEVEQIGRRFMAGLRFNF